MGGSHSVSLSSIRGMDEAERLRRDLDALMEASWQAYVLTGADPDGREKWHQTPVMAGRALVYAVAQLRDDYDEALGEL